MKRAGAPDEGLYSAREVFGSDLLRDEDVLWWGQPDPSILLTKADILLIPFSVLWAGFAFFVSGVMLVIVLHGGLVALVPGIIAWPMGLMGLYLLFGRFAYKRWLKCRTYYALTQIRVLSLTRALGRHLAAAYLRDVPAVSRYVRPDGSGSLWFGNAPWWAMLLQSDAMDTFIPVAGVPVVFYDIRAADRVYELVQRVKAGDYRK